MTTLYERLGGTEGITAIANDVVDLHCANPVIAPRFAGCDVAAVKHGAATFFITGTGGPACYEGKAMRETHRKRHISDAELMAVLDDAMKALEKNGVGQREKEEVLHVLFSMRGEIVGG